MSVIFSFLQMDGLCKAHLSQLLGYIKDMDQYARCVGNKNQFEKRHEELRKWINDAVEYAYSEGVVMHGDKRDSKE